MALSRRDLRLVQSSGERVESMGGLAYLTLTMPQEAFVNATGSEVLWRDGNQLGKSFALVVLVLKVALHTHPTIHRRGPQHIAVISVSKEQMIPLMRKFWELVPKDRLTFGDFVPGFGFRGKPARLAFDNGSTVSFTTYGQGSGRIAGDTLDMVVLDEPPPESLYGEVQPRVLRKRGLIRVTMTPTPDMPDQSWYRERVEEGLVKAVGPFGVHAQHLQPAGFPTPWLFQEEIDEYASKLLSVERRMRIEGSWDPLVEGRWLDAFDEDRHMRLVRNEEVRGWRLAVGADHGTIGKKQTAVLVAVLHHQTPRPKVRILAEAVSDGTTTPEHDAQDILAMLKSRGLSYDNVDEWVGDVPTSSRRHQVRKSNRELRKELARQLGRRLDETQYIHPPEKFGGSLTYGMRMLNTLFKRDDMVVDRSCVEFAKACNTFAGDKKDPGKDVLDGGRYAVERTCTGRVMAALQARY